MSYRGATSPNPPVAAAALDEQGNLLSLLGHERAGEPHAEVRVLEDCERRGILGLIRTLVVTLEPCNHQGRTPPCVDAILRSPIRRVIFGVLDPNPRVAGNGREKLIQAGLQVIDLGQTDDRAPREIDPSANSLTDCTTLADKARELIQPFAHWARTGMPWITLKTAWTREGSMIPPGGKKTFTSPSSLRLAHQLRRQADAIVTGSGTVLSDWPEFTVRHLPDHAGKRRLLAILDRRGRVPETYLEEKRGQGFEVIRHDGELRDFLGALGSRGVLEALVEAGPTLSSRFLHEGLWNRHIMIRQGWGSEPDRIENLILREKGTPECSLE